MQITYKDPYESTQKLIIPEGDAEALKEVLDFLNENARAIQNAERRERYHTQYHFEAMDYENDFAAYNDSPEYVLSRKEELYEINSSLALLTKTQFRRLTMYADGMTLREICRTNGASAAAVKDSIDAARKKFLKYF